MRYSVQHEFIYTCGRADIEEEGSIVSAYDRRRVFATSWGFFVR